MIYQLKVFTLIEMVVVIIIIGVASGVAIISFGTLTSKSLEGEARKIVSNLQWAREMAATRHNNYVVDFDTVNDKYQIYSQSNPARSVERSLRKVDLVSVTPSPSRITFSYPSGSSQSKQITLRYQGVSRQIIVYGETGYIEIR